MQGGEAVPPFPRVLRRPPLDISAPPPHNGRAGGFGKNEAFPGRNADVSMRHDLTRGLVAAALLLAWGMTAGAAPLERAFVLDGFAAPEGVAVDPETGTAYVSNMSSALENQTPASRHLEAGPCRAGRRTGPPPTSSP